MRECGFAEVLYRGLSLSFKAQCLPQIEGGLRPAGCHVVAQTRGYQPVSRILLCFSYISVTRI